MTIAALVLAAVASRRRSMLEATLVEVRSSRCDHIGVVLGAEASDVAPRLAGTGVTLVLNAAWEEGVASSIRTAMHWTARDHAVLILLCDQPHLTAAHLDALIAAHLATGRTVATRQDGVRGLPAIFGRASYPALAALQGDEGPWTVIDDDAIVIDGPGSEGLTRQSGAMRSL